MKTETLSSSPEVMSLLLGQEGAVLGAPSGAGEAGAGAAGATGEAAPAGPQPGAPAGGGVANYLPFLMIGMVVIMILSSVMSGRKQKKQREQLLGGVKKSDRVQTIGGVIGTVVELRDDAMVLKVHEASNTRVTFARSALQTILKSGRDGGSEGEASEAEREGAAA